MHVVFWIRVAYEEYEEYEGLGRCRMNSYNRKQSHVRFRSNQPSLPHTRNTLVSFISLSADCCSDQVVIQTWLDTICSLKVTGVVHSAWMFSLEAGILLKVLFGCHTFLVSLQFCFVNPWLGVLKECHLCFTSAEDIPCLLGMLYCGAGSAPFLPLFANTVFMLPQ